MERAAKKLRINPLLIVLKIGFLCKLLEYYTGTVVKLKDNVEYLQGEVLLVTFHNFSVLENFLSSVK